MYDYILVPGPCVMCGTCARLRTLSGGVHYDGICEMCDETRFRQLNPRKRWVPWNEWRALEKARSASHLAAVRPRPAGSPTAPAPAGRGAVRALRRAS